MSNKTALSKSVRVEPKPIYSALQYVMWLIGGSEISILKKCPADYNRHATIGFTLLMTCLFASVAGGYAGYFFSRIGKEDGNIGAAISVGLIWGLLVYSIDRSMVVSLKKNPEDTRQSFWPQLVVRGLLGFLIAFFISIPLELLIFQESIETQVEIDKTNEQIDLHKKLEEVNQTAKLDKRLKEQQKQKDKADLESQSLPNTAAYFAAKATADQCSNEESVLTKNFGELKQKSNRAYNSIPLLVRTADDGSISRYQDRSSAQWLTYQRYKAEASKKGKERELKDRECDGYTKEVAGLVKTWQEKKAKEADSLGKAAAKTGKNLGEAETTVATKDTTFKKTIENQNGFVRRFVALGNAADFDKNFDLWMLLWLVRAIFILIEILPTVVKIYTPVGQYDWAAHQLEKDFTEITLRQQSIQSQNDAGQEQAEMARQQAFRLEKEGEVHDDIVKKLAEVQATIAKGVLEEYKAQQLEKAPKNMGSFMPKQV